MKKEDMKGEIIKHALVNSLGTAVYIIVIASFLYLGGQGVFGQNASVFIPIAMLMVFVFSAAFTGFLMFGRPIMWYLDGKKKEALSLLVYTLGFFLFITLIALLLLMRFSN
jgi:hypothetical protein